MPRSDEQLSSGIRLTITSTGPARRGARRLQRALAVVQVEEHADAGFDDLRHRVAGLDLLAARRDSSLITSTSNGRGLPETAFMSRTKVGHFRELDTRDAVVHVHMLLSNAPAFLQRILTRVLNLAADALASSVSAHLLVPFKRCQ